MVIKSVTGGVELSTRHNLESREKRVSVRDHPEKADLWVHL